MGKSFGSASTLSNTTLSLWLDRSGVNSVNYVAEVDVELIESDNGWSPYLSVGDAYKLDDVRKMARDLPRVKR